MVGGIGDRDVGSDVLALRSNERVCPQVQNFVGVVACWDGVDGDE